MTRNSLPARLLVASILASALAGCAPAALRTQAGASVSVATGFDSVQVRDGSFRRPGPRLLVSRAPEGSFVYPLLMPSSGRAVLLQGQEGRYSLPPLNGYTQIFTVVSRSPLPLTADTVAGASSVDAIGMLVESATRGLPAGSWDVTTDVFRVSDFGTLVIDSFPPGSDVSLNGSQVGTTPLRLEAVEVGRAQVSVSHDGYAATSRTLQIGADQTARLLVRLAPLPVTTGLLNVTSNVPAAVTVDELNYGAAPVSLRLGAGGHSVIVKSGTATQTLNLQIRAGARLNVACQDTDAGFRCSF